MKKHVKITALCLLIGTFLTSCTKSGLPTGDGYTYHDYVTTLATNWNPHTYETAADSYPAELIRTGLYGIIFNDEVSENGDDAFAGYEIIPEMAAEMPIDITEEIKRVRPEFGITESATSGYAYRIPLNKDARWEDGTPINADTYVYSMKRLLDPELLNYRASDYYTGALEIAGAEDYATKKGGSFDDVGLFKSGEYEITLVLAKSLSEFDLVYSLTGNFIVYEELYEASLKREGDAYFSTYNTGKDTTVSYGPYKLVSYQKDKAMRFEKNEEWYGYTDGKHTFIDPVSGEVRDMYQTTAVDVSVVGEAATAKLMFLGGELIRYTLTAEDYASLKNSDYAYETPGETMFFLILNGHIDALSEREASSGFDKTKTDLEVMSLESFRRALSLTYDKELFAATLTPARSGGYGLIGDAYIYDPEKLLRYRDTRQAKEVLCDFYGIDISEYPSIDAAVESITGYDGELAREYYTEAFREGIEAGYITDNDGDGICDQTVTIEYCMAADSDLMTRTVDYLNEKILPGTPFSGKIKFVKSAPYGNDWVNKIKSGLSDVVLGGWSGSRLDPFGLSELYVNPEYQYDAEWFNASYVVMELNINGEPVTMNLRQWSEALNGKTVTSHGKEYNFGSGSGDVSVRLDILAAIEKEILSTYNYIPMLQDASVELLSAKAYYVVDEYNPVLGRGGLAYLGYNYNDGEWRDYVKSQNGELRY